MLENPLTPPERFRAVRLVEATDPALAEKLDRELADDGGPLVKLFAASFGDIVKELRFTRWAVIGLAVVCIASNVALVGVSMNLGGPGFSLSTTARAAEPPHAEHLEAAAGPVPQPADPQL